MTMLWQREIESCNVDVVRASTLGYTRSIRLRPVFFTSYESKNLRFAGITTGILKDRRGIQGSKRSLKFRPQNTANAVYKSSFLDAILRKKEKHMKTIIALTTHTFALVAEKFLVQRAVSRKCTPEGKLTDEIRRYDTGDLILP